MTERTRRVDLDPQDYDDQWARLAAAGQEVHGEADRVERLLHENRGDEHRPDEGDGAVPAGRRGRVLDAGCGTGRVAIRLAARGFATVGVDVDRALLAHAEAKAPECDWVVADLAALGPDEVAGPFDAIVAAGNVMIFVAPGTEAAVVSHLAARLAPGGLLVCGFQLTGRLPLDRYDAIAEDAGLVRVARDASWDGEPFTGGDYVVTVDRRPI